MARNVNTGDICVIKKCFWNDKAFRNEVIMLRSFSHVRLSIEILIHTHLLIRGKASIVRYIDHDTALTFVAVEWVEGGNLEEQHSVRPLTHREVEIMVHDVLDALTYVHSHGVIHHDIKPEYILVSVVSSLVYMQSANVQTKSALSNAPLSFTVEKAVFGLRLWEHHADHVISR